MGIEKPGRSGTAVTAATTPTELDVKLLKFRMQLYRSREELAKSHPNLEEMEELVRSSMVIDPSRRQRTLPLSVYDGGRGSSSSRSHGKAGIPPTAHTTATYNISSSPTAGQCLQQRLTPDPVSSEKERSRAQEWNKLVNRVNQNLQRKSKFNSVNNHHNGNAPGQVQFTPIVETDLDTGWIIFCHYHCNNSSYLPYSFLESCVHILSIIAVRYRLQHYHRFLPLTWNFLSLV